MGGRQGEKCGQPGQVGGQLDGNQSGGSGGSELVLEEEAGQGEGELLGGKVCVGRRI